VPVIKIAASSLIMFVRSVPPIVWLFLVYFGLGSGPLQVGGAQAAIVALGIVTAANMAEIYRGALASIHHGQWEACRALNFSSWWTFYDVVAPQLVRVAIPSMATHLIGLMKDTAIASTVGVADIAFQANFVSRREFEGLRVFAFAGLLYIFLSVPIAALARYTDAQLRSRVAR
jgi:polar amino acid transport system permease protein